MAQCVRRDGRMDRKEGTGHGRPGGSAEPAWGGRLSCQARWSGQVLLRGEECSRVEGGEGVCRAGATKKNILDWRNSQSQGPKAG